MNRAGPVLVGERLGLALEARANCVPRDDESHLHRRWLRLHVVYACTKFEYNLTIPI
jgi:hypothetical protein